MKRAIRTHRIDFAAIAVLVVAAIGVSAYILEHQPSFVFGQSYYTVRAPFATAAAVTSGQGQAVTIAGVQVGQVGGVSLQNGQAMVTMNIYKQYAPIYRNATVLLRPRTPLKDMYLELDPGTRSAGRIPNGGTLSAANTQPDVDVSEILSSLDSDTRNYLILLLSAGAQAFHDPASGAGVAPSADAVADLRGTLKRFEPLDRDTKRFATLLATRQANIRRAIHNLSLVTNAFGGVEGQLASLIRASDTNFSAIAANDTQLQQTLTEFPPTLQQSITTLNKVRGFANASTTTLQQLLPFARNLGPALKASRPLFKDTTPVIANQLRPFSVAVQPLARTLAAGAPKLKATIPALSSSISVLNTLFNELAHQPPKGQQSYLFWGSWLAHIADSLTSTQDANGAVLQGIFMNTCAGLDFYEKTLEPASLPLGVILDLLNAPDVDKLPGVTPSVIPGQVNCPTTP
ncbi:MAG TPA: MlaD family protein [Solirubrobacteraceae bacterium]|nr:MlaD family protein [Solirubrobacteraceae bacterium]